VSPLLLFYWPEEPFSRTDRDAQTCRKSQVLNPPLKKCSARTVIALTILFFIDLILHFSIYIYIESGLLPLHAVHWPRLLKSCVSRMPIILVTKAFFSTRRRCLDISNVQLAEKKRNGQSYFFCSKFHAKLNSFRHFPPEFFLLSFLKRNSAVLTSLKLNFCGFWKNSRIRDTFKWILNNLSGKIEGGK